MDELQGAKYKEKLSRFTFAKNAKATPLTGNPLEGYAGGTNTVDTNLFELAFEAQVVVEAFTFG